MWRLPDGLCAWGLGMGLRWGAGAVTIDVIFAVLSSVGVAPLVDSPYFRWPLTVASIVLLMYLGILCLKSAYNARKSMQNPFETAEIARVESKKLTSYVTGLVMTGLNPYTWMWWFATLPGVGTTTQHPRHDLPIICIGVFIATLTWVLGFVTTLAVLKKLVGRGLVVAADTLGGITLTGFSIYLIWLSVGRLL